VHRLGDMPKQFWLMSLRVSKGGEQSLHQICQAPLLFRSVSVRVKLMRSSGSPLQSLLNQLVSILVEPHMLRMR